MSFTVELPGVRRVTTNRNDTLKRIALRELGDASRWVDIALLNNLKPPYIVDLESDRIAGVIVTGDIIDIPAPLPTNSLITDADGVFLKDTRLDKGLLAAFNGDLVKASGFDNLKQALQIRIGTLKTELMFHPDYGCYLKQLLGDSSDPTTEALAAFYVKSSLLEDERVSEVVSVNVQMVGDALRVEADVKTITGRTISIGSIIK